jgi:nucleotide-binding universal stress UspA family protein
MAHWPPTRILVAVDFGDASAAALSLAGRLAAPLGAQLVAVHAEAIDVPPYFTRRQLDAIEREVATARHQAEESLVEFARANTSVPVVTRLSQAPEVEAILEAGRDADLIVVGTHGRRGPKRWWLGSVAERVVREAHVPVLVVHAATHGRGRADAALSPVVLGGEHAGADAHRWGELIAATLGGPLFAGPDVEACDSARVESTSFVIVTLPNRPGHRVVHEQVVSLARTCTVPVLFVPESVTEPATR